MHSFLKNATKLIPLLTILVTIGILLSCQPSSKYIIKNPPAFQRENIAEPLQEFLGDEIIDALAKAKTIRAYLLNDSNKELSLTEPDSDTDDSIDENHSGKNGEKNKNPVLPKIGGREVLQKGSALSSLELKNFQHWAGDAENYNFLIKKRCLFVPQVLFELGTGEKNLWVFVSFPCKQWKFQLQEETTGVEDIMNIEAHLIYLAQRSLKDKKLFAEYLPKEDIQESSLTTEQKKDETENEELNQGEAE